MAELTSDDKLYISHPLSVYIDRLEKEIHEGCPCENCEGDRDLLKGAREFQKKFRRGKLVWVES